MLDLELVLVVNWNQLFYVMQASILFAWSNISAEMFFFNRIGIGLQTLIASYASDSQMEIKKVSIRNYSLISILAGNCTRFGFRLNLVNILLRKRNSLFITLEIFLKNRSFQQYEPSTDCVFSGGQDRQKKWRAEWYVAKFLDHSFQTFLYPRLREKTCCFPYSFR